MLTRKERKVRPAEGKCLWVVRPTVERPLGLLLINNTLYSIVLLPACVRLLKQDGKIYDVHTALEPWECDCPDYQYARAGKDPLGCKHVLASSSSPLGGGGDKSGRVATVGLLVAVAPEREFCGRGCSRSAA